jgi:hypothetical protein
MIFLMANWLENGIRFAPVRLSAASFLVRFAADLLANY